MEQLRKSITVVILGEEVSIDVDFRLIEVIERAFDTAADQVITLLVKPGGIQRRRVADVLADAIIRKNPTKWSRDAIREDVITSSMDAYKDHVSNIEAALLFSLKVIKAEDFDGVKAEIADSRKKKQTAASPPAVTA